MTETVPCRICGGPVDVDQAEDTYGAHADCLDDVLELIGEVPE